jgi:hypothetical protein
MTAELYLKGETTSISCNELESRTDIVEENIALKAIKMAREEEREKAWKAFKSVYCSQYCGLDCEKCRNKNVQKFKELINM